MLHELCDRRFNEGTLTQLRVVAEIRIDVVIRDSKLNDHAADLLRSSRIVVKTEFWLG